MSAITDVAKQLFSRKLILKKLPDNRLKVVDFSKLQAIPSVGTRLGRGVYRSNNMPSNVFSYINNSNNNPIESLRTSMYIDYEAMESDPIITAALDIYANESTSDDASGNIVTINCEDATKKGLLYNLYHDILNIDFNLWHWIRSMCKYGDLFLYLNIRPGIGVIDAIPLSAIDVRRSDTEGDNNTETRFFLTNGMTTNPLNSTDYIEFYEMAHFRILADTNFIPYGRSMIEGARKVWKQLLLLEDAMIVSRIMRAPERRIYNIEVGNIPADGVDAYVENISNSMKKVPYIDPATGDYNLRFNLINMLEDVFIPKRGDAASTTVETLSGLQNEGSLDDIQYLQKKLLAFLKIPPSYLGYESESEGKGTLAAIDVNFSKIIERVQKVVISELEKIGQLHLLAQGFDEEELVDFSLSFSSSSILYERQKVDLMNEKMTLIQNIIEQKILSKKWIYENLLNMSHSEWAEEQLLIIEDLKRDFREEQIKSEGNDPEVTGESYGTAHDIVSMQLASKIGSQNPETGVGKAVRYTPDSRADNKGRPKKPGSFKRDKDPSHGRDPDGSKALNSKPAEPAGVNTESNTEKYKRTNKLIKSYAKKNSSAIQLIEELEQQNEDIIKKHSYDIKNDNV